MPLRMEPRGRSGREDGGEFEDDAVGAVDAGAVVERRQRGCVP